MGYLVEQYSTYMVTPFFSALGVGLPKPMASGLQLATALSRGPIVLVADQNQQWHVDLAVELRRTGRVVGDGGTQAHQD